MDPSLLTPAEFEQFQAFIFDVCGIRVPENKVTLLSNRIRRRLKATNAADFQEYWKLLKSPQGDSELSGFLNAVTTNETAFFRTVKHFDWLRGPFVDDLRERARLGQHPREIRVWSAACSTGEEPYSIAFCLLENQFKLSGWKLEVLASDLSEQALDTARAGVYGPHVVDEVSDKQRKLFFRQNPRDEKWEIKPAVKDIVRFRRHNLMQPLPDKPFDCIFIRNVLIYFNRESKQVVIENLVNAMAEGAYLVVGPSEGIFDMLGMLKRHSTFLYQKTGTCT